MSPSTASTDDNRAPLIAIGEAKWADTMGMGHLDRLRRIRALLTAQGRHGAVTAKLACYSGTGFTEELTTAAPRERHRPRRTPRAVRAIMSR